MMTAEVSGTRRHPRAPSSITIVIAAVLVGRMSLTPIPSARCRRGDPGLRRAPIWRARADQCPKVRLVAARSVPPDTGLDVAMWSPRDPMESIFRRYLPALDLAVIFVCAGLLAHAAATLVEAECNASLSSLAERSIGRPLRPPVTPRLTAAPLTRNIFCSTCPTDAARPVNPPPDLADHPVPSKMQLRLLATMVAASPADVGWSIAVIHDRDDGTVGPYAIDSQIRGATVTSIESTRVYLRVGHGREYLDLLASQPGSRVREVSSSPAPALSSPVGDPLASALDRGIRQIGPRRYEVQRSALDLLVGNTNALSRAVRVMPETRSGHATGLRLLNVQPHGPIARIGLQSGDMVSTINGLDLSSAENALVAYTKLRSASHLEIGLERAGARLVNSYDIR